MSQAVRYKELAKKLRALADRLPMPWEEDRYYGEIEIARLEADAATVRQAAAALDACSDSTTRK